MEGDPLFSFGVVADIQYGDKPHEHASSDTSRIKRYREATGKLAMAVEHFNSIAPGLRCVLSLGDIIDGNETEELSSMDLEAVEKELQKLEVEDVFHVIGNHCLRLPRSTLLPRLGLRQPYYEVPLHHGWRLLVLDSMDLSIRWPSGAPELQDAETFLRDHPLDSDSEPQMKGWNGGLRKQQLSWLSDCLREAEQASERVIVAVHHPMASGSAPDTHFMWNYEEVCSAILCSPAAVLVLSGHYHPGGYACVGDTHFVVVEAILEAPPNTPAHAVVRVFPHAIQIEGCGAVTGRLLELAPGAEVPPADPPEPSTRGDPTVSLECLQ